MDRIIDDESRKYLKDKFESLTDEVDINVYYDDDNDDVRDYVEFTKKFASEIADISDKIKLSLVQSKVGSQTKSGMTIRTNPSITIGEDKGYKILFSGSPLGYEASQIIETIIMVSTGNHEFDENIVNELKSLSKDVHVKVFVTPTCPYCPGSAYLANRVAVASKGKVLSETIEANENPDLAAQWNIVSVPTQIINDDERSITIGLQEENEFVNLVLSYGK